MYPFDPPLPQPTPSDPTTDSDGSATGALALDVDPQILEALRSKDRIYVLKLGESFESLITERRQRVELTPATSYQRLLVHRCSAYYKLLPENDPLTKATIFVLTTQDSRIPDRRICELVPAESVTQPAFKIMRRLAQERRKPQSHSGSVAGDDLENSDVEASESSSLGGRISTANSKKQPKTIEEREAAYNEARSRIFMDFQEKSKDKDMSASSSTLSLDGSASTSAGGRSSIGDADDTASSPATESEWSVPSGSNSRDKKDGRRGGPPSASASSSRSLRTGGSFHTNGSGGSSRNSRAPSPSFSFASLHDPTGQIYDPHAPSQGYYPPQYAYPPFPPPGQAQAPPYLVPYPYYPQQYNHHQPPPPLPQHGPADGSVPPSSEPYSPAHYQPHYGWAPHPHQQPVQSPPQGMQMSPPPQQQSQQHTHAMGPPFPPQSPPYQPFPPHPHGYGYPLNGYYPPPPPPPPHGQQMPAPPVPHITMHPPLSQQQIHHNPNYDLPRSLNGNQMGHATNGHFNTHNNSNHNHNQNHNQNHNHNARNGLGNGVLPNHNARATSKNNGGPVPNSQQSNGIFVNGYGVNGGRNRVPNPGRSPWSYGPGIGGSGYAPIGSHGGDAMGPRFNSNRRTSGNGSSGGNSRSSSNCDEVSSTSSTTSSSSRRTYTSTSSQHPLPPRPDWAVGIKAQPTLAATGGRAHLSDHSLTNSRTMSPISPPRSNSNGHNSPMPPNASSSSQHNTSQTVASLQSTDFPPLTSSSAAAQEKKGPVVTGAWGNSRPVLSPTNGNINSSPGHVPVAQSPIARQDENERGVLERPSPKAGDVFSPKIVRRPPTTTINGLVHPQRPQVPQQQQMERISITKGDSVFGTIAVTTLGGQVSAMSLGVGEELNGVEQQQLSYTTGVSGAEESASPSTIVVAPSPSM